MKKDKTARQEIVSSGKLHHILHRVFLICMFGMSSIAVIFLVRQQVSGATGIANTTSAISAGTLNTDTSSDSRDYDYERATQLTTTTAIPATAAVCYYPSVATVTAAPTTLCKSGESSELKSSDSGWTWKCLGKNGGSDASCSVKRYVEIVTITPASSTAATATSVATTTPTNTTATSKSDAPTSSGATVTSNNTGSSNSQAASSPVVNVVSSEKSVKIDISDKDDASDDKSDSNDIENQTTASEQAAKVVSPTGAISPERAKAKIEIVSDLGKDNLTAIDKPVSILAENIKTEQNPKVFGTIDKTLTVEKVDVVKNREDSGKKMKLSGKAQPNMLITIYIYSENPIVITVKTDENGDWSYELDEELEDGTHQVYATVSDDSGKILSKSSPIAFVKTAEAASIIPGAEVQSNQAPLVRSQKQYVLIALIIMTVCLAIALVLIGIITHKRHLDEGID